MSACQSAFNPRHIIHLLKISFILTMALAISACGPTIYKSPQKQIIGDERNSLITAKPPSGKATLFVVYEGVNETLSQVHINNQLIAKVDYGFVRLDLIPGEYSISRGFAGRNNRNDIYAPVTLKLEESKTYYKSFGWQKKGNKTYTKTFEFSKKINQLPYMPMHKSATDPANLYPLNIQTSLDGCLGTKKVSECLSLKNDKSYPLLKLADKNAVEAFIAEEERQQAEMRALEESLPPSLRRDKYMLQLSTLLKEKNYEKALPVFEKLTALGLPLDPSFDYFRGESYLNVNQKTEALKYLYNYIRNQGSSAKYYKQALELINKAEGS